MSEGLLPLQQTSSFNQLATGPEELWEDKMEDESLLGMENTGASYTKLVSQMTFQTSVL